MADEAGSISEAEAKVTARDARFDAVILDVGLPDGDGRDLCASLRRQGMRMPIIMLTGSDDEADVVRGLDSGANDYIAKPFRLAELLARLRAQLRIFENSEDAVFTIGPYTFRPSAKLLQEPVKQPPHPPDREGGGDPEVPVPRRHQAGGAAGAAERGLGLQRRRHHAHAGDPHLPAAPEDRARSRQRPAAGHRGRRLPARPRRACRRPELTDGPGRCTATGTWSDGCGQSRASVRIVWLRRAGARSGLTQIWSSRRPRLDRASPGCGTTTRCTASRPPARNGAARREPGAVPGLHALDLDRGVADHAQQLLVAPDVVLQRGDVQVADQHGAADAGGRRTSRSPRPRTPACGRTSGSAPGPATSPPAGT